MRALVYICGSFGLLTAGDGVVNVKPIVGEPAEVVFDLGEPWFTEALAPLPQETLPLANGYGGEAASFYDFGDPTVYEQLMLELVNRARADPGAEAARLGIDLNEGLSAGTIQDTLKQPLAWHSALIDAARLHSIWMLETDTFNHIGVNGSTPSQRAQAAGYPAGAGENITWRGTIGVLNLLQTTISSHEALFLSSGERVNLCNNTYREIGFGIEEGIFLQNSTAWNALMTTQKFGSSPHTNPPFMTGVVYYDFDGDDFYDVGEGIQGISVLVEDGDFYTETATAGGYSVPIPSSGGVRDVRFVGPGLDTVSSVVFASNLNHKVDLVLSYPFPAFSGSSAAFTGFANSLGVSAVPGATAMQIETYLLGAASPDPADDLSRVEDGTAAGYSAISTAIKRSEVGAYRFAHPIHGTMETLTYIDPFRVGANAELSFYSRLGFATATQVGKVQVSEDGGATWETLFAQGGTSNSGETMFNLRTVSLAEYAGAVVHLRFNYHHEGGIGYTEVDNGFGWYVDDISFSGMEAMEPVSVVEHAVDEAFDFTPGTEADYLLLARPIHYGRFWPNGVPHVVSATVPNLFEAWGAQHEIDAGLPFGSISGNPLEDHAGAGLANLLAYAMGLDPIIADVEKLPRWEDDRGERFFAYQRDISASGAVLTVELSTDLNEWFAPGDRELEFVAEDVLFDVNRNIEFRRISINEGSPPAVFVRLRAVMP